MAPLGRVVHALLQRPLRMRPPPRRAPELHPPTDIIPAPLTKLARLARQAHLQRHEVPDGKPLDAGADGLDAPGGLVAEGQRLADEDVAVAVVGVVVQVGAAEGGGEDLELEVGGGGGREGAGGLWGSALCLLPWLRVEGVREGRGLTMRMSRGPWRTDAWTVRVAIVGYEAAHGSREKRWCVCVCV